MKIFISLGTQKQSFKRLCNLINESEVINEFDVSIQLGYTKYDFKNKEFKVYDFINEQEFINQIEKADIIICHAGAGILFSSLNKNKKIISIARLKEYKEHLNSHQQELLEKLASENYIIKLENNLDSILKNIDNIQLKKYVNENNYLEKIMKEIENL